MAPGGADDRPAVAQDEVGRRQQGRRDGDHGLLGTPAGAQAGELRAGIALAHPAGGPGGLHEHRLEPRSAVAEAGRAPLAGAFVHLRTQPGPGNQVSGGREAGHVQANLRNEGLGDHGRHARDRAQPGDGVTEGA